MFHAAGEDLILRKKIIQSFNWKLALSHYFSLLIQVCSDFQLERCIIFHFTFKQCLKRSQNRLFHTHPIAWTPDSQGSCLPVRAIQHVKYLLASWHSCQLKKNCLQQMASIAELWQKKWKLEEYTALAAFFTCSSIARCRHF